LPHFCTTFPNILISYYAAYSAINWLISLTLCILFPFQTMMFIHFYGVIFSLHFHSLGGAYSLVRSVGGIISFSSFFVRSKMTTPKTPCFALSSVTQTSAVSKVKFLHKHAKQCLLCWFQAGLSKLGVEELI